MVRHQPSDRSLIAVVALAVSVVATGCSSGTAEPAASAASISSVDTELVPVVRQDVIETVKAQAGVGNGTGITLPIEAEGLVTWAQPAGSVLTSGDIIVEVSGRPILLVIGERPLYRPLRLVGRYETDEANTRLGQQTGADVAQLQQYLIAEGFDDKGRLTVDEVFGVSTQRAVKQWQASVGHPATGVVDASQLVFFTNDVLLQTELAVGQQFTEVGVTGTGTVLQVEGSTSLRDFFPVGETVEVNTEPPMTGVVIRSTRVAGGDDGGVRQLIEISVEGANPDELGQSVEVIGSMIQAADVLTVPVRALLAMTGGGWQVEVDSTGGVDNIKKVEVELVSVFGTTAIIEGLEEDDQIVVPL